MRSFDRKANVGIRNVDIANVLVKDDGGGCRCLRGRENQNEEASSREMGAELR